MCKINRWKFHCSCAPRFVPNLHMKRPLSYSWFFFRNKGMLLMLRWILVFTKVNTCSWYACMNFIFMESRLPLLNRSGYCCFVRLDIVCVYIIKAYCLLYLGKTLEITQNLQDIHKGRLLFPGARQDSYTHGRWKF